MSSISKATPPKVMERPNVRFPDGVAVSESIKDPKQRLASFDFSFTGPFFAGDCTLGAATLTVFDDGRVDWRANSVMSRDDGEDSWLATFEFFDAHGISLWRFGRISSPTLHPTPLVWISENQLFYPSFMFNSISLARMTFSC